MLRKIFRNYLHKKGLQLVFKPKTELNTKNELAYSSVLPNATYAPWLNDAAFMGIYNQIKQQTLVDIYRCFELWEITKQIQQINPNAAILEVGVYKGGTAAVISTQLQQLKSTNKLYLADTFIGVAKATEKDCMYVGGEHADTSIDLVEQTIKPIYKNYTILKGIFPNDTQQLVQENEVFGLCHIDVDVYESAKDVVAWVWPKLVLGGIIVFDDYGFASCNGVTNLVNEYKLLNDRIVLHNLNGHAIIVKLN
jgi:O-methyltransferase